MLCELKIVFCLFVACVFLDESKFINGQEESCGRQKALSTNKTAASIGEFPWTALLRNKEENGEFDQYSLCIGALINRRYVLTSAICATSQFLNSSGIVLGEHDVSQAPDCETKEEEEEVCADPVQEYGIEKSIVHSEFRPGSIYHDIALIRLNEDVTFTDYVQPICLPTTESPTLQAGDILMGTGWGMVDNGGPLANIKKKVASKVVDHDVCVDEYKKKRNITEEIVCTNQSQENTEFICTGDSGAPLMREIDGRWQQEAVVSFGVGCGGKRSDGNSYVRKYLDWIKDHVEAF